MQITRDMWTDFLLFARSVRTSPAYFFTCIGTLALGIALTTALLSVVDAVLVRPLGFKDVDRLVTVGAVDGGFTLPGVPQRTIPLWSADGGSFERVETYYESLTELGAPLEPTSLKVTRVGSGLFDLLGVQPRRGRVFNTDDFLGNASPVAIVSDAFVRSHLGTDLPAVGRTINLGGTLHTIVGVMHPGFTFHAFPPAVWVPLRAGDVTNPEALLRVVARLRVPLDAAQKWADAHATTLARERSEPSVSKIRITPMGQWRANPDVKRALWVVMASAFCVLLIACSNTANLTLVRNASRVREIAVRSAMGASRMRLLRQLLVESASLAVVAGGLGILLASWMLAVIVPFLPQDVTLSSFHAIAIDSRVLIATTAIAIGTGLVFGMIPAFQGAAAGEHLATMVGRLSTEGRKSGRIRATVLASQVAFATVLLSGAALFGRSFLHVLDVDPGLEVERLAALSIQLPRSRYPDSVRRAQFYERLEDALGRLGGVTGVSRTSGAPPHAGISFGLNIEAEGLAKPTAQPSVMPTATVDTNYFRTSGTRLLSGRGFTADDLHPEARAAIVNEPFAKWLWGHQSPLGRRFRMDSAGPWITVVGVAEDAKLGGPTGPGGTNESLQSDNLSVYHPLRTARSFATLLVRTNGEPVALLPNIRRAVREIDAGQPIDEVSTMEARFGEAVAKPRFFLWLMMAFGIAALVVASIGVYGTASFGARRRSRELAIRMALGATERGVTHHVMRHTVGVVVAGVATGLVVAMVLSRSVKSLLFSVSPTDPASLCAAVAALAAAALLATYIPVARVVRAEPFKVLRAD